MDCRVEECGHQAHSKGLCLMHWKRWRRNGDPLVFDPKYLPRPLEQRFAEKVVPGPVVREEFGPCLVWTGSTNNYGYGQMRINGRIEMAHRVAFFLADGRWPTKFALHVCDNPPCVLRAHLFEGGYAENAVDRQAKGRQNRRPGDLRRTIPTRANGRWRAKGFAHT